MNYRHAFHAGGFADVVKHVVLSLVVGHLREKPAAFRVIDTHAGAGLYDLTGPDPGRTGEWRDGIGRLLAAALAPPVQGLLAPYLAAIRHFNPGGNLATYPGSPTLVLALMRPQDRLVACELEPAAGNNLARHLKRDRRARAVVIDGWTALSAYVPPKERRGLVLVDPPFERPGEFARLTDGVFAAHRKWASGSFVLWYPIKDRREADVFLRRMARSGIRKILKAELAVAALDRTRLTASGLLIINPPWPLERQLAVLLPALASILARDTNVGATCDWLTGEK
jgi:23S rRNA (adenine2030-N6)-methyltransferase